MVDLYLKSGLAKVEEGIKFMDILIDNNVKFLWYGHHQAVLDQYEDHIKSKKIEYIRIDGKTADKGIYMKFQSETRIRIALLSITAAYQGITMTQSSTVVFSEYYWTPGIMFQAEDRVHRVSQKN